MSHRIAPSTAASALLRRDMAVALSYPVPFLLEFAAAAFAVVTTWFVAKLVDPQDVPGGYFAFVTLGLALTALLAGAVGMLAGTVRDEQNRGTLEAMVATGVPPSSLAVGLSAYPMVASAASGLWYLLVALLMGARFEMSGLPVAVAAALLGGCSFAAIGIMGAALTIAIQRAAGIVGWIVAVLGLAAGELFPPELMPGWLQALAKLSPVTWVLVAVRDALLGGAGIDVGLAPLLVLAVMAIVLAAVAVSSLAQALRYAKARGTLGGY
ncbi:MAG: ABC transporter permease [Actinomycetota bacterium]